MRCARPSTVRRIGTHFAFDLLHLDGWDLRRLSLKQRRALLRNMIRPDKRSPIKFSDHIGGDGAKFFRAAAELGLEGIVSKRLASRYCSGRSRSWLKTKNMVEGEFILLCTHRDANGIPWALLASDRDGELEFAGGHHESASAGQVHIVAKPGPGPPNFIKIFMRSQHPLVSKW
jgi:ATP-dependent DNA ligase